MKDLLEKVSVECTGIGLKSKEKNKYWYNALMRIIYAKVCHEVNKRRSERIIWYENNFVSYNAMNDLGNNNKKW